jgi:DNA-directed RNA polymerase subunit RPC12/RpoP
MSDHDFTYRVKTPYGIFDMPLCNPITCPICGFEIEIWTEDEETICFICGFKLFKKETTIH